MARRGREREKRRALTTLGEVGAEDVLEGVFVHDSRGTHLRRKESTVSLEKSHHSPREISVLLFRAGLNPLWALRQCKYRGPPFSLSNFQYQISFH
ncbi:hypothetical protein AVEN_244476-1 [Araneus ventricosus]|uniref:Uncharacterized protein n=1 Tax=Araneus ventricosus TaxID=182803 RepID=A0A4Y2KZW6_ARAVE|nr:hypothetical protein AVEN_244476-1 [Araneus ventricosus]